MDRPCFLLTNDQRACLGLAPVEEGWTWVRLKDSPYDTGFETWACFDGGVIRAAVQAGPEVYHEAAYHEETVEDRTVLLPRTSRGKPQKLSATTLMARKPLGVCFTWSTRYGPISVVNADTHWTYYSSVWDSVDLKSLAELAAWLDRWTAETTPEDLSDLAAFRQAKRRHVKFREGDFFRFRVGRRLYGYGRVLLDHYRLTKRQPTWDIVMCRPVIVKVYHLLTADPAVPVEDLRRLSALPSQYMMDDDLYYGEYPIVGHLPLEADELDYPIMYGGSISAQDRGRGKVLLQCGPLFRELDGAEVLPGCQGFRNNGVGGLHLDRAIWEACIAAGDNGPLWERQANRDRETERAIRAGEFRVSIRDLRNPAYRRELEAVCAQFGLTAGDLHV